MNSKQDEINIKKLNEYGIGILKLSKLFKKSTKTIQKILVKSNNLVDKRVIINKTYNEHIDDSQIQYYIDATSCKLKPLYTHDRETLYNFPKIYIIASKHGKIVDYYLTFKKSEYAFDYYQSVVKAKIPKGSIIHVDMYSTQLFSELEKKGYIVVHKNKRVRQFPFYQQVEHLFSNIQKAIRRLSKKINLKELSKDLSESLVDSLIQLYHYNNYKPYLEWINRYESKTITVKVKVKGK